MVATSNLSFAVIILLMHEWHVHQELVLGLIVMRRSSSLEYYDIR